MRLNKKPWISIRSQPKWRTASISEVSDGLDINIGRFPALIQRIKEPKSTALIFEAGKMVITGTKSEEMSKDAAQKFVQRISKATNQIITVDSILTSNIVANS